MRYVLIDRITALEPPEVARGIKCVSLGEDFFVDHFPGLPVMPGALMLESLAQLGGTLIESCLRQRGQPSLCAMLAMIDRARFRQSVRPGDRLELEARATSIGDEAGQVHGAARVEGKLAVEADLSFVYVPVANPKLLQARAEYHRILLSGSSE